MKRLCNSKVKLYANQLSKEVKQSTQHIKSGRRGRPKRVKPVRQPEPCVECGEVGDVYVDAAGIEVPETRCKKCYEVFCMRQYREHYKIRYG